VFFRISIYHLKKMTPISHKKSLDKTARKWYNGIIGGSLSHNGKSGGMTGMKRILPAGDLAFKKENGKK